MPELAHQLRSVIGEGCERLKRAGIPEPRREALSLWADMARVSPAEALVDGHLPVGPEQAAEFRRAVQRRARGEPLAHITGWIGFRHLVLRSDSRALIPRPETEGLVELLLARVKSGVIADIGTGSGCIALSLAREGDFSRVVGVDCSSAALALAQTNSKIVGTDVDFVRADLCTGFQCGAFDAVIANLPYLSVAEYAQLDSSVRLWEPGVALVSGLDGLEATGRLIREAQGVVRDGGWLALELDCNRSRVVARLAAEHGWCDVSIHMDLFGRERYLLARRSDTGDLG
jgi:release factor glutamine methyltransferase